MSLHSSRSNLSVSFCVPTRYLASLASRRLPSFRVFVIISLSLFTLNYMSNLPMDTYMMMPGSLFPRYLLPGELYGFAPVLERFLMIATRCFGSSSHSNPCPSMYTMCLSRYRQCSHPDDSTSRALLL